MCIDSGIISNVIKLESYQNEDISHLRDKFQEYEIEDLGELYVCPGIIDLNCSLGYDTSIILESHSADDQSTSLISDEEKYTIGTGSAAAGGVTTIIESPSVYNSEMLDSGSFERKLNKMQGVKLYCDIGFLASITPSNIIEVEHLAERGVLGFKCFMIPPAAEYEYFDKDHLWLALRELSFLNKPLFVHSEVTSERYVYMNSPFRIESVDCRQYNPKPIIDMFPAAFPEDLSPISDEERTPCSPDNYTGSPISLNDVGRQEKKLERKLKMTFSSIEKLVSAEIVSYADSGSTVYNSEDEETAISLQSRDSNSSLSSPEPPNTYSRLRARSDGGLNFPRRPPKITCKRHNNLIVETNYQDVLVGAPPIWEENCVKIIAKELAKYPQCRVHICNLSSAQACFTLCKKKSENSSLKLTSETASFYLYFSDDRIERGETFFKVHPPVREPANKKLLWDILQLDKIDAVASYHRPITPTFKFLTSGDFQRAVSGINSIGFNLQSVWNAFSGDCRTVIPKIFKLLSENPAKIIGLDKQKGSISIGKHADIVVWDPFKPCISSPSLYLYSNTHPFLKESMKGRVYRTYVRGKLSYCKNTLIESAGSILV